MTAEEAKRVTAIVKTWSPDDRQWWRDLLQQHPGEALIVAQALLTFEATIVEAP